MCSYPLEENNGHERALKSHWRREAYFTAARALGAHLTAYMSVDKTYNHFSFDMGGQQLLEKD